LTNEVVDLTAVFTNSVLDYFLNFIFCLLYALKQEHQNAV